MPAVTRYLALAFASADLLLEIDAARRIVFALGAQAGDGATLGGKDVAASLVGRHIAELAAAPDVADLAILLSDLPSGQRRGPMQIRLLTAEGVTRAAEICVFALPELTPHISCSVTYRDRVARETAQPTEPLDPASFRDRVRDLVTAATSRGRGLSLALIEIHGLIEAGQKFAPDTLDDLMTQIRQILCRHGTEGAATGLSETRYAVVQGPQNDLDGLMLALNQIAAGAGLTVSGQSTPLFTQKDPLHLFRAVRVALECFLQSGLPRDASGLRRSFAAVLDETARSADRLDTILEQRRFDLYYQPVVDLETELATHFEVLVRFDKNVGPTAMIKLAEDLEMVEGLDGAVVEQAVRRLSTPGSERLKLAVNISGGTLLKDNFLQRLLTATQADLRLRQRLQLEITETAALHDLDAAARRMRALKEAGFLMSIDDFGSGAAGYDYVRALPVDAVKIDGRYIRGLDRDPRAQTIVKHLVQLCEELGLNTVAEMIEREEELVAVRAAGVRCGQGWLYGKAEPEPCQPRRQPPLRARRVGDRETWM